MPFENAYRSTEPTRDEIDRLTGPVLLEFGTDWCPICQRLQPDLERLLAQRPDIRHIKVEDGAGRPLGRSFRVKLWPNLVFLRDGQLLLQQARPTPAQVEEGLRALS